MVRKGYLRSGAALGLLVALAGCGSASAGAAQSASRGTIGISMPTTTSPRWIADGSNIAKQLTLLGYKPELSYAENDAQKQAAQIQGMIGHGDKALIIGAVDGSALTQVLQGATAANIPVLAYDRLIRNTAAVSYYASFDNYRVGVLQAEYLVGALGLRSGAGSHTIELFAGSADDNNAGFFFRGAMSVLKPYLASGRLVVASGTTAFAQVTTKAWDGDVAKARMTALLATTYASTRLDAVLSPYDGISRGILTALTAAGYGKAGKPFPAVTGQDAELDSVKLIAAGTQQETIYKDTRELAKVVVHMTNSLVRGEELPEVNDTTQYNNGVKAVPSFLLQPVSVTRKNYVRVLVDGGYYTAAQISG